MADNFQDNVSYRSSTLGVSGDAIAVGSAAGVKSIIFSNSDSVGHLIWQPSGNVTLSLPSGGGVVHVAGSAPGAIAAGTQTASSGTIVYSNSNNVSFGMSGSTQVTASYNFNVSGGTTSNNLNSIVFSNSNNVSFGLNGSTLTATITVPAQTNQSVGLYATGNTTQNSSTTLDARSLTFNALGAATMGYSNGSIQVSVPVQTVQTQSLIAGVYDGVASISTGTIRFTNANGVSFSINGQTLSGSVAAQTVQTVGLYALGNTTQNSSTTLDARTLSFNGLGNITVGYSNGSIQVSGSQTVQTSNIVVPSAGTQTATSGTVVYSNSNNITFGMSGSSRVTASYNFNLSAGTTSNNLNAVTFSNSNGLSFGLDAGTVTGSYTVPTQTNQSVGLYALGNTTQNSSTTLDARSLSFNGLGAATLGYSNGSIQVSVPVQTVQTQSNIAGVYDGVASISTGTIRFTNANGVSFSINGQTISGSVAAQTAQTVGLYALGNTTQNSSTTLDARSLSFNGLGAATVGYSNGSIQISVPNALTNVNISAGTTSNNLTAFVFSNSNNVSFGLNGSTVTATATVLQTNQTVGLYALGNTTQNSSTTLDARTLSFNGLGAATVGYSNGSIQISVPVQTVQTQSLIAGVYDGVASISTGTIRFTNANGVSFSINGQTISGSVAAQTAQTVGLYALGNTTQNSSTTLDARTLSFNGLGAATVGYSNGSIQVSVPVQTAQTQSNIAGIYDGVASISTGTIRFTNANGVSFSINGQTISGSVAAQTNQTVGLYALGNTTQNSSTTLDARSLSFNGIGAATVGYSNGSIQISVPNALTNINISAGTTSNNLTAFVFSNSNNVSFGLNGSTVTATVTVSQTNQTVGLYALGNTTQNSSTTLDARTLSFNGLGAATVGYSNGSIQVSVPVQTVQTQSLIAGVYDGANSISTGTIRFTNANGVSFSINGQTISGSVAAQTAQTLGLYAVSNTTQNSSTTLDARTLSFQGAGIASVGYSNGSIIVSVPSGGGAGDGVNIIAAGTQTANTTGTVMFSNSNNVSFGMTNSSIVTASFSQSNQTIGLYALGNTTQNSSSTFNATAISFNGLGAATVGYSNSSVQLSVPNVTNLFVAGMITGSTNANSVTLGAAMNVSAGTTSNNVTALTFSNSNGVSFGLNGSVITVDMNLRPEVFEPFPLYTSSSAGYLPVVGSLYIQPFMADNSVGSGRLNIIKSFSNSNAGILAASNSVSIHSNTLGSRSVSYSYVKSAILYTRGTGTNNTRIESFWSNTWSLGIAQSVSVSTIAGSNVAFTNAATVSYIASVGTNGAYTSSSYSASYSTSSAATNMGTSLGSSGFSSLFNLLSAGVIIPIGFNTSISAGNYWFGQAFNISSTTAGTTATLLVLAHQSAAFIFPSQSAVRVFGNTITASLSMFKPGQGVYSAITTAVPANIAFTDIRSFATQVAQYFNIMSSNA